jgi:hypothetical protein
VSIKVISAWEFSYEHIGLHRHPQPPGGKLHPQQFEKVKQIIQANPNATPHELRIGSSLLPNGPGQSLGSIAPQLNNVDVVGRLKKKVLTETPGLITSIRGSDIFILDYITFQQDCPDFVRHFKITNDVKIISVQTTFMQNILSEYWSDITRYGNPTQTTGDVTELCPMVFQHGCVTDAANKFFSNGKLLVTCCYFEVTHRWQPILLSWIGGENTETYAAHFFTLFNAISEGLEQKGITDGEHSRLAICQAIVGTVVDYSDAQRKGFQTAYSQYLTTTRFGCELLLSNWDLSSAVKFILPTFDELYQNAGSLLKGCK